MVQDIKVNFKNLCWSLAGLEELKKKTTLKLTTIAEIVETSFTQIRITSLYYDNRL